MNDLLSRHQLVAHWAPGALFLATILPMYNGMSWSQAINNLAGHASISISAFAIAAFVLGEIFDSIRDLGEWVFDFLCKIKWLRFIKFVIREVNWDYFTEAQNKQIANLKDHYFDYYVFNINAFIALSMTGMVSIISHQFCALPIYVRTLGIIFALILLADGLFLRFEIAKHTSQNATEN